MKTITLQAPGRLASYQTDFPAPPPPSAALVRVRRIGVCGTDLNAFRGKQPFFSYPRILGHELGVEILEVGENDRGLKPGDRCAVEPCLHCGHCVACRQGKTNCCVNLNLIGVHSDGGMRERIVVPIHKLHKSDALSCDELALVEPLSIGAHAVERAQLQPGEFVLVVGAGPIGLAVLQFAQFKNVRLIVMDVNESRLAFCRQHYQVEATVTAEGDFTGELQRLTGGDMPTVVFDATGNPASMNRAFDLVANGGRLVFVGLFQGEVTFHDPDFHRRELTVMSSRNSTGDDFRRVISMMETGQVEINKWISHRVSFDAAAEQFPQWLNPQAGFIKGLIEL